MSISPTRLAHSSQPDSPLPVRLRKVLFRSSLVLFLLPFIMAAMPVAECRSVQNGAIVTEAELVRRVERKADFVFLLDASISMGGEITGVADGFSEFATELQLSSIDARFCIVLFGDDPELVLDFTSDVDHVDLILHAIRVGNGGVPGLHKGHGSPEAGLEAIRMVLGASGELLTLGPQLGASDGRLHFRNDAFVNIILATDEDSDQPFYSSNRFPSLQEELDATGDAVISQGAFVNLLVSTSGNSENQYGVHSLSVENPDFTGFDPVATYTNLVAGGYGGCLEARVLEAGLIGRAFDIGVAGSPAFIQNFFAAKVREVSMGCPPVVEIALVDLEPIFGTTMEAGVPFVLSGQSVTSDSEHPVLAVHVNSRPADSIDVTGRFFLPILLEEGVNHFEIESFNACGSDTTFVEFVGSPTGTVIDSFSDHTAFMEVNYRNTTYDQGLGVLTIEAAVCNQYTAPLPGPFLMVFENFANPTIQPINHDGLLPDGRPYFVFHGLVGRDQPLAPGECSANRVIQFSNPNQEPFNFTHSWLAPGNAAPVFVSSPATAVAPDELYVYQVLAQDAEQEVVQYALLVGPLGMVLDSVSGRLTWTPSVGELGVHEVVVEARDLAGGVTTQQWRLQVTVLSGQQPPFFTTAPVTHSSVGASFAYVAAAMDPNGDDLTFTLLDGPAGMSAASDGLVQWAFTLPGNYPMHLLVEDGQGGSAEQGWLLTVGTHSTNPHSPSLSGNPAAVAAAGIPYIYQPLGSDPDAGDILTFSLSEAPVGMAILPGTGRVTWNPGLAQVGSHDVGLRVEDGNGGFATQAWSVEVFPSAPNLPPVVISSPNSIALVGFGYEYDVEAVDPNGDSVSYELVSPPTGMTIDAITGLVSWMPFTPGAVTVAIKVTDSSMVGDPFGSQVFELVVAPPNSPPNIVSTPVTSAIAGATWYYDVNAVDPDSHTLSYTLLEGPVGMQVQEHTGVLSWSAGISDLGANPVRVRVDDPYFGFDEQAFVVTVLDDVSPPVVEITASPDPALMNELTQLCVLAGDDVGIVSATLAVNGVSVALDPSRCAQYLFAGPGVVDLDATAMDAAGNLTMTSRQLQIVDPNDGDPPVIEPLLPEPGGLVRAPMEITGTIQDNTPASLSWQVELSSYRTGDTWVLGAGTGNVLGGVLAQLDPTSLANDQYKIRIEASDGINPGVFLEYDVGIEGDYKLGNYAVSFVDMVAPVGEFPMVVTRNYSSLDGEQGDFGIGWSLGLPGSVYDTPLEVGGGTFESTYRANTRVFVTLADGSRQSFRVVLQPVGLFAGAVVRFEAEGGAQGTLELAEGISNYVFVSGGFLFEFTDPWNPDRFVYIDESDNRFHLSEIDGLELIEDRQGNTIEVREDGLYSSLGSAIVFERDGAGRIKKVIEPNPGGGQPAPELEYFYDGLGRLAAFEDGLNRRTEYFYEDVDFPFYMTKIEDPLGRPVVRNKFDENGRLIAQCGPEGNLITCEGCVSYEIDPMGAHQTIFTGAGDRIDLFFDDRGYLVLERFWVSATETLDVVRTYDEAGRVLTESYPGGATSSFEYNDDGDWTLFEDSVGRHWDRIFGGDGNLLSVNTPDGDIFTFEYDSEGRRLASTDPLLRRTEYAYNSLGYLETVTEPNGSVWTFMQDPMGRPIGFTDPSGIMETYVYSDTGRLLQNVDREGRQVDLVYDDAGQLETETWSDGNVVQYSYDAGGQLTGIVDQHSSLVLDYWLDGSLRSVNTEGTPGAPDFELVYGFGPLSNPSKGYDGRGNVSHVTDSFGGVSEFEWDVLNRQVAATQGTGALPLVAGGLRNRDALPFGQLTSAGPGVLPKRFEWNWTSPGNVDSNVLRGLRRFSDAGGLNAVANTEVDYDCSGCGWRISDIEHSGTSGSPIHALSYTRNSNGGVTAWTDAEGQHLVGLDGMGQILSVDHPQGGIQPDESYNYDGSGNRVSSHLSASYNLEPSTNKLLADDTYDYEYDRNGCLILRTERTTSAKLRMAYDHRLRLTQVVEEAGSGQVLHTLDLAYDGLHRLIRKDLDGIATHFFFDGQNPMLATNAQGVVIERRFYGRGIDQLLAIDRGGETLWPLEDVTGSIRDWVRSDGSVASHHVYDTFGRDLSQNLGQQSPAFGFQSREVLGLGELYDFRARPYLPGTGRFAEEDPLGPFRYGFGANNPLVYTDPTGTSVMLGYVCLATSAVGRAKAIAAAFGQPSARVLAAVGLVIGDPSAANIKNAQNAANSLIGSIVSYYSGEDLVRGIPKKEAIRRLGIGCAVSHGGLLAFLIEQADKDMGLNKSK